MVAVHAASPAPDADLASELGSLLLAHKQIVAPNWQLDAVVRRMPVLRRFGVSVDASRTAIRELSARATCPVPMRAPLVELLCTRLDGDLAALAMAARALWMRAWAPCVVAALDVARRLNALDVAERVIEIASSAPRSRYWIPVLEPAPSLANLIIPRIWLPALEALCALDPVRAVQLVFDRYGALLRDGADPVHLLELVVAAKGIDQDHARACASAFRSVHSQRAEDAARWFSTFVRLWLATTGSRPHTAVFAWLDGQEVVHREPQALLDELACDRTKAMAGTPHEVARRLIDDESALRAILLDPTGLDSRMAPWTLPRWKSLLADAVSTPQPALAIVHDFAGRLGQPRWAAALITGDLVRLGVAPTEEITARGQRFVVRLLDKRRDLLAYLRFADVPARSCFRSDTPYYTESKYPTRPELLAAWRDPLTFCFHIENDRCEACGFLFGSFAIADGAPAVVFNSLHVRPRNAELRIAILRAVERGLCAPPRDPTPRDRQSPWRSRSASQRLRAAQRGHHATPRAVHERRADQDGRRRHLHRGERPGRDHGSALEHDPKDTPMSLHLTGYVDMVDVNTVLERLDPTLLARLGDVWLSVSSRGGRQLGYVTTRGRRDVTLCTILPIRISMREIMRRGNRAAEFGAPERGQWPPWAVRRLMLYHVLLHEIGHLQIVRASSRIKRRFAAEPLADEFAADLRGALYSTPFAHGDPVHNAPSDEELAMLGWWEKLDKEARARVTLSVVNDRRKPSEMEVEMTADQASFMDRVTVRHPRTFSRQRPLRSQRSAHV